MMIENLKANLFNDDVEYCLQFAGMNIKFSARKAISKEDLGNILIEQGNNLKARHCPDGSGERLQPSSERL